jgi:hypothetical protein
MRCGYFDENYVEKLKGKHLKGDEFIIRIIGAREGDPVQYNLPSTDDLAMLIIGEFSLDNFKRDYWFLMLLVLTSLK